jgi:hypothetical protein
VTVDTAVLDELSALALHMTGYLSRAGQVDRLLMLFDDDRRMLRCFDPAIGGWDGYQEDIDTTWDALDRSLATPHPDAEDPVPRLVRLALARATLSSIDEVPPAMLSAAVGSGTWTVDQALSTISRHPAPESRAAMLYELLDLDDLDRDVRQTIRSQLVELGQVPTVDLPADALLSRLELLEPAERLTVVDRIAADASITSAVVNGPITGPRVTCATAVDAFEAVPETRRPVLVDKVADALLDSLAAPRPDAGDNPPGHGASGGFRPLMEQHYDDMSRAVVDDERQRDRNADLLARLIPFLGVHADLRRLVDRGAAVVAHLPGDEHRARLATALRELAAARLPGWAPTTHADPEHGADRSAADRSRGRLMAEMLRLHGHMESDGEDDRGFLAPNLDELNRRWIASALPSPETPETGDDLSEESTEEADPEPYPLVRAELQRVGGPAFMGLAATVNGLSDEMLYELVGSAADHEDLGGQFFVVSYLAENQEDDTARQALRKVKAGLLMAAIEHHLRHGSLRAAWRGIEEEDLVDVHWDPVLVSVLRLPVEEQRNSLDMMYGIASEPAVDNIPRFAALRLLLAHLREEQVGVALADVLRCTDPTIRRVGLELIAPRLAPTDVARAIQGLETPGGRPRAELAPERAGTPDSRGRRPVGPRRRVESGSGRQDAVGPRPRARRRHRGATY